VFSEEDAMIKINRILVALPFPIVLAACIALPIESGGEEPFADERLTYIEVGESTKEDIATAMPRPMKFLGGDLWLYARSRTEQKWLFLAATPSGGGAETIGGVDYRFLLVRFDENGIVSGYETSSLEKRDGCNRSGVCKSGTSYSLFAPEDHDRVFKQFNIPPGRCGVYVYGKQRGKIPISVDDQSVGWLQDKVYVFEELDPGIHELIAANINYVGHEPMEFNCVAGSPVFFEVKTKGPGLFGGRFEVEVMQRDASEGRQAIARRKLMLQAGE